MCAQSVDAGETLADSDSLDVSGSTGFYLYFSADQDEVLTLGVETQSNQEHQVRLRLSALD